MTKPLGPDATIGVACLGVTHPHTSGRVRAVQRRDDLRLLGAADDHPILKVFTDALGIPARSKEEILADPRYADDEPLGPDEGARERFREFARKRLGST